MATGGDLEVNIFREVFKRCKKSVDFSDVLDFTCPDQLSRFKVAVKFHRGSCSSSDSSKAEAFGLCPPSKWQLYSLPDNPGLLVIPNPFIRGGQHTLVRKCLVEYPCKPNVCNLDAHMERQGNGSVWPPTWSDQGKPPRSPEKKKQKLSNAAEKPTKRTISKDSSLWSLRWVTLGYHYNWTTKEYSSEKWSPFPSDLAELSSFVLHHAGYAGFKAEAAIVNYYHLDSTLSGHTDHSEKDLTLPLLSISFGQSAIFLIGGKTKQVKPTPLLLRSGDIVIMAGDSRLAHHGVPKILPPLGKELVPDCLSVEALSHYFSGVCHCQSGHITTTSDNTTPSIGGEHSVKGKEVMEETVEKCHSISSGKLEISKDSSCCHNEVLSSWPDFISYLSASRINVNVRQVESHLCKF